MFDNEIDRLDKSIITMTKLNGYLLYTPLGRIIVHPPRRVYIYIYIIYYNAITAHCSIIYVIETRRAAQPFPNPGPHIRYSCGLGTISTAVSRIPHNVGRVQSRSRITHAIYYCNNNNAMCTGRARTGGVTYSRSSASPCICIRDVRWTVHNRSTVVQGARVRSYIKCLRRVHTAA